jgi:uncharacterized protein DUF2442
MTISEHKARRMTLSGRARDVHFGDNTLVIDLDDGRQIAVPLTWFPRLAGATDNQRSNWALIGRGIGISWPDVDEDISVENLLGSDGELLLAADASATRERSHERALHLDQLGQLIAAANAGDQQRVDEILVEMGFEGNSLQIARLILQHQEWDDVEAFPEMSITFHVRPGHPVVFETTEWAGAASNTGSEDSEPTPVSGNRIAHTKGAAPEGTAPVNER